MRALTADHQILQSSLRACVAIEQHIRSQLRRLTTDVNKCHSSSCWTSRATPKCVTWQRFSRTKNFRKRKWWKRTFPQSLHNWVLQSSQPLHIFRNQRQKHVFRSYFIESSNVSTSSEVYGQKNAAVEPLLLLFLPRHCSLLSILGGQRVIVVAPQ